MVNSQFAARQSSPFVLDPSEDPDNLSQIAIAENAPQPTPSPAAAAAAPVSGIVPKSFTEWAGDPNNLAKIPEAPPPGTPMPSVAAKAITSGMQSLFQPSAFDPTPIPTPTQSVQPLAGPPRTSSDQSNYNPQPPTSQPGMPGPASLHVPTRAEILADHPVVLPLPPQVPHGKKLAAMGLFTAMDNIGSFLTHSEPSVGPGLMHNVEALQEYNRNLPIMKQQAENQTVDEALRQMDTGSQIALRNAQSYTMTHPLKPTAAKPIFDKTGNLLGFEDVDGSMIGPNSPKLTPDMRDMMNAAEQRSTKPTTPEGQVMAYMISQGKTPAEAFQQIEQIKQQGKPETSAQDDQRYENIKAMQSLGRPISPEDAAWASAYVQRKTLVPTATFNLNAPGKANDRVDKSFTQNDTKLDKLAAPVEDKQQRLSTLLGNVNLNTAAADSVIAPELLTVMAGGQGSGVRMTDSEIRRITSGRSSMQDMKALLQKVAGGGQSFTSDQRDQVRQMVDLVHSKIDRKLQIIDNARNQMLDATTVEAHRAIVSKAKRDLDSVDAGDLAQQTSNTAGQPQPNQSAGLPALAPGYVRFKDSQGNMHDIPKGNLQKAKQRDPGLQIIQQ